MKDSYKQFATPVVEKKYPRATFYGVSEGGPVRYLGWTLFKPEHYKILRNWLVCRNYIRVAGKKIKTVAELHKELSP
jgi:hypothetical protein